MKPTLLAALLALSLPAHAVDLDDIKSLRTGEVAGVQYKVHTKSLRLRTHFSDVQAALRVEYDGDAELVLARPLRNGGLRLEAAQKQDERRVWFLMEARF